MKKAILALVFIAGISGLYAQKAITLTPNGDGHDDAVKFKTINMTSCKVIVSDKTGRILFQNEMQESNWEGRDMNGKEVPAGNYLYTIAATSADGREYNQKGSICLTRQPFSATKKK